ncbi:MAG TPA: Fe-S cluster assembly protein SufD [Pyrinomonadaceae bacterium]|nr:Fe-S cluster assembly protein SufD [Pyrinomonadaceae bacterium]
MAQAIKEKSSQLAELLHASDATGAPAWVARLREAALERLERTGFPTTGEEDWKYTNVAPLARATFVRPSETEALSLDPTTVAPLLYAEASGSRLVFVNGFYSPDLSSLDALPAGVVASELAEALNGEHAEILRERLTQAEEGDAFAALNAAALPGGAFLYLPKGVRVEAPVQLLFLADARGEGLPAVFPRVVVFAERESEATLVEAYAAASEQAEYFTDAVVDVFVGENARLTHFKVQREGERAFHVAATRAELSRASFYDITTVTLGARLSRHNVSVRLNEEGAECRVDGLYLVGTGQHTDTHSLIDHRVPRCASRQNYKGILDGRSRAVFNGRVFVHEGASGTDAVQSNKNLLLSREARVDTKPQLEIFNDDVKCAHGATVGQLEEEELFYLLSRGLHPELARNLLTYGFAEEIVNKIGIDSIKAQLDEAILGRLHARLEA